MLFPQSNSLRQSKELAAFWDLRFDAANVGLQANWKNGFTEGRPAAVPASWNDQFEDGRDFLGPAWYQTSFNLPWGWNSQNQHRIMLRFGSVNYLADIWLNGISLGSHEGGHLPFEFEITDLVRADDNLLVVRVDGQLAPDRVPPGNIPPDPGDTFPNRAFPDASFDFFPFCGIHRPVVIYAIPSEGIADITVVTDIQAQAGIIQIQIRRTGDGTAVIARSTLRSHGVELSAEQSFVADTSEMTIIVPDATLWSPDSPALYELTVMLIHDGVPSDQYSLHIGIRTIQVDGDQLLLNGKPIKLVGFGRHEDFPIAGRGFVPAVVIKDFALMQWTGANSFRTTHYPYAEQMMELADRLGFLIIDETPAVGLFFREEGLQRRLGLCRQYTRELIARDKNHPSVIMWSLANEPHSWKPDAKAFFRDLYELAKSMDSTRPITVVSFLGKREEAFEFCDVMCLNRYYGWYSQQGYLTEGVDLLSAELDELYATYQKPLILSEFGADTLAGWHAQPPEMFSEEYQAEMLTRYIELLNSKSYVVGQHVWNLCDFKTGQGIHRVGGLNLKGVFTRDRRPKLAAHQLKLLWSK
jgi:beta-glucuronidase